MTNIARRAGKAQCNLCGEQKSATQMGNHIAQELESVQRTQRWNEAVADLKSFLHLEIQHQHAKHFWMHLLVQHQTTLGQLDAFLRCVWLECCDHLSRFDFHGLAAASPGTKKPSLLEFDEDDDDYDDDDGEPLIDWDTTAIRAMPPGMTGTHEYDFGSTTTLDITSNRTMRLAMEGNILLIARNAPVQCDVCEKEPANTLIPTVGTITDPDGQRHQSTLYVPICQACVPPEPDEEPTDCPEECPVCDQDDDDTGAPIPVVNSPRLYDSDCFMVEELREPVPAPRCRETRPATRARRSTENREPETPTEEEPNMDDDSYPWLDPILDNVERWPNLLIMDSLLESAAILADNTPSPDAIVKALDGLEKLAMARTLCGETGDHCKYFHEAPDWTYTPRESDEALEQQGDARRFRDDVDIVVADATLSWNDGDAIFMVAHQPL